VLDFVPIFWRSLSRALSPQFKTAVKLSNGEVLNLPLTSLTVSQPQIMQSVSVDVTERHGLKGSSLYAAMHSLHAIRWILGLMKFGQGKTYKEFPLSKKDT
jgi:hypothetical protein